MVNLETYLEQIQNNESISAAGIGFSIDSPHTNKRTLSNKIKEEPEDEDVMN